MQDDVGVPNLFQGGPEGLHQFVRQVGDEAHRVGQDRRPPAGQTQLAQGRVQGGEQHVLGQDLGLGQAVEQGRLAGVGVAHQRDGRIRHAATRDALQAARAANVSQFLLQPHHLVGQQAPVGLDLGFTRTAHDAKAAPLALEVGPGAHQARTLVVEPGQLDLQLAFPRAGAAGEDLQDQPGAVDHLDLAGALQVALLHGAERIVDHDDVDLLTIADAGDLLDLAGPEQGGGRDRAQGYDQALADVEVQGLGQADGLVQTRLGGPQRGLARADGMDDEGDLDLRSPINGFGCQSSPFSSGPGS